MNSSQIIRILLNVIDKLLALIETLDTEKKLTSTLKTHTDDLSEALRNAQSTPEQK